MLEVKELVKIGVMSFNDAAKAKGLPKETLRHWLQKTTSKQGSERKTILTKQRRKNTF